MTRRVFFSFHYEADNWRAAQVRNIGSIEGNSPAKDNDWESLTRGGDRAIERWIGGQMAGRSCAVVLIGANTAGRKWIDYEIKTAWSLGLGLLGIHVHRLLDRHQRPGTMGPNPFAGFEVQGTNLSRIVPAHDPFAWDSKASYAIISTNISAWIEQAVAIRSRY